MIDCGNGVGRQLRLAGLDLAKVRHVFLTHHHSDHVADLVTLPLLIWGSEAEQTITLHGPPPLKQAVKAGLKEFAFDVETRIADEGKPDLRRLVKIDEFSGDGVVLDDGKVKVTAARVEHPPIREAYAYRFDTPEGSFVFSGDTAPSANLVKLAKGADVLVHEVLTISGEEMAGLLGVPTDHPLAKHIVASHTSVRDVGRIAKEAGVGKLVLTHFVPADRPIDEEALRAVIAKDFDGEIVFGRDLERIEP